MLAMQRISGWEVAPDGHSLLFELRTTDVEANRGRYDIWLTDAGGGEPRRLTTNEASDTSPRWLPDGRSFVFLSSRGGSSQVWRMSLDGGEAAQLTHFPVDVDNLRVFPDGKRLLLGIAVKPDTTAGKELEETAKSDAEAEASKVKARVYDSLLFRHWDSWDDGKRNHVFVWEIGGGAPRDLMHGMDADSPPKPFGGAEEFAISPDGKGVVFGARVHTKDAAWTTDLNLYFAPADGSAPARNLTADNKAQDSGPCFSPDGKWLAYLAMARPGYESDRQRIVLMQAGPTGFQAPRVLTEAWDRSPGDLSWSNDGKTLYASADNLGQHSLFAVDAASGAVRTLVEQGTNSAPLEVAGGRVLFGQDTLDQPLELFTVAATGGELSALTHINRERIGATSRGSFEQFSFTGAHGDKVYAYAGKPAGFVEGKKYPVALLIHGGPQGSFGNHFHYRWNPQAYAGAGYAAVFVDFHGSTGYGQAFTDAVNHDWGGAPYEDLMKGLDAALAKYPWMDGSRCGALGASFGGYMINWIAGQTDRFKCLISHDGNIDERLAYLDTEELWFPEWEHGGTPWGNPEGYAKHNPIDFIQNWKTPWLVIHGGKDYRVVDTQGMASFTALQRKGIPSKFLYFPDENHWVLKPQNSILWHDTVLGWLDQWTKGADGGGGKSAPGR
ncbi:MAG: S9 family peptidase [Planctomycetes bacterium]|nr:S9 family peptidase [Planctomycetota bacterium]